LAYVDWRIRGPELSTCNCDWGCPCQFNARPTRGNCSAVVAMRIDDGHFGDVRLDGLHWVSVISWPGAIHEGRGTALVVVDERADEAQRTALLTILAGKETDPGATIFNVLAGTLETMLKPRFEPIDFEVDIEARTGQFSVTGLVEAKAEPIRNPVTGEPHQARLTLPAGFEYAEAEFGSSTTRAGDPLALDWTGRHAHFAMLHLTPTGPVR
jgi:hypothetical protein